MDLLANQENNITIKKLESHLVKTILGALAVGIVGAFFTSLAFYYNSINKFQDLEQSKVETKVEMKELKDNVEGIKYDVGEIKTSLSNTGIYTTDNKERISTLEQDVKEIKESQVEMIKILYELKARRNK
jgi:ABC-type transport system substrate-binding protein